MSFKILSLDGGGIRGLVPAIWLSRLEKRLSKPLYDTFDLIAGTSTGALLGCAIAAGLPSDRVVQLYRKRGHEVFPRVWFQGFRNRWLGPKYSPDGLVRGLDSVFKSLLLSDLHTRVLVTAYDTFCSRAVVIDSDQPLPKSYCDHRVQAVCRASAAAPTYFPSTSLPIGGRMVPLIDGGVVANNPTLLAIAAAAKSSGNGLSDMTVVSLGTGEPVYRITAEQGRQWSAAQWLLRIVPVLFDGGAEGAHWAAEPMVPNYFRFQIPLERKYAAMDNASPPNLSALSQLAIDYIDSGEGREKMDRLVEKLEES